MRVSGTARTDVARLSAAPRLGDVLLAEGTLAPSEIGAALSIQRRCGGRLGEILLAEALIDEATLMRALSRQLGLPLLAEPPADDADAAAEPHAAAFYSRALVLPCAVSDGRIVYATCDPAAAHSALVGRQALDSFALVLATRRRLVEAIGARFGGLLGALASEALYHAEPDYSARTSLSPEQKPVVLGAAGALLLGLIVAPLGALATIGVVGALGFSGTLALRFAVAAVGIWPRLGAAHAPPDARDLPLYTVLVPLYREARSIPGLIRALRALDYPAAKLDIKLIVEADDHATAAAIAAERPPPIFEVIAVPALGPRTKPKACNYALHFARGAFVVIYDAEDQPAPDQLRKAVAAFRAGPPDLGCVQARLQFYNAHENWLTGQFALEYLFWFNLLLPGLDRLGLPIPLGGTSNHFPTALLRRLYGWDPYNVTEDADLGLRLAQEGYRCGMLDSVTYEEATCDFGAWLRQRTRWLKGYLQTYAVHMRRPGRLLARLGWPGFLGVQVIIGGTVGAALLHPLWVIGLLDWALRGSEADLFGPLCRGLLVAGNLAAIGAGVLAVLRRGQFHLLGATLTIPVYWLLLSLAGYRAVWQWMRRPFLWEKTEHGVSRIDWADVQAAALLEAEAAAHAAPGPGTAPRRPFGRLPSCLLRDSRGKQRLNRR